MFERTSCPIFIVKYSLYEKGHDFGHILYTRKTLPLEDFLRPERTSSSMGSESEPSSGELNSSSSSEYNSTRSCVCCCCLPCNNCSNWTWVVGRNFGLWYEAAFYALQGVRSLCTFSDYVQGLPTNTVLYSVYKYGESCYVNLMM